MYNGCVGQGANSSSVQNIPYPCTSRTCTTLTPTTVFLASLYHVHLPLSFAECLYTYRLQKRNSKSIQSDHNLEILVCFRRENWTKSSAVSLSNIKTLINIHFFCIFFMYYWVFEETKTNKLQEKPNVTASHNSILHQLLNSTNERKTMPSLLQKE